LIFIFDNVSKRKRLNTPVKENCRKNLQFETQSDYAIASDLERNIIDIDDSLISSVKKLSCADKASNKCDGDDEQGEDSELLQDLYSMLPIVLRNLEEVGQKDSYKIYQLNPFRQFSFGKHLLSSFPGPCRLVFFQSSI